MRIRRARFFRGGQQVAQAAERHEDSATARILEDDMLEGAVNPLDRRGVRTFEVAQIRAKFELDQQAVERIWGGAYRRLCD